MCMSLMSRPAGLVMSCMLDLRLSFLLRELSRMKYFCAWLATCAKATSIHSGNLYHLGRRKVKKLNVNYSGIADNSGHQVRSSPQKMNDLLRPSLCVQDKANCKKAEHDSGVPVWGSGR